MTTLTFGTPGNPDATILLLLGAGELGREVAIEAMRLGVEVHAADAYHGAPAMQLAHHGHVIDMQDGEALRELVAKVRPDFIVPEVEAIATDTLIALEGEGHNVVPTARATRLTMDREHIRRLVAEDLGLPTSPYAFADSEESFEAAVEKVGVPCIVKPVMSSSGKGQSLVKDRAKAKEAWDYAMAGSRGRSTRVIVEGFVDFDTEITLLTVRHRDGTSFCPPIGHRQERGDYMESWQPQPLPEGVLERSQAMAKEVTDALAAGSSTGGSSSGYGLFGVELFIAGDEVIFSELSPRPHDTGMVTMVTQQLSEFALHVRAILGIPVPKTIELLTPGASAVILAPGGGRSEGSMPHYTVDPTPLRVPGTDLRLFAKPTTRPYRRMGVALARGEDADQARARAAAVALGVHVTSQS